MHALPFNQHLAGCGQGLKNIDYYFKANYMETLTDKDALTVIQERKSVRNYTGEPAGKEAIDKLLRAAMAAPSAVHMMPWKFIVVTDIKKLEKLAGGLPFAKMLVKAGTGIVVCAVATEAAGSSEEFAILDCTCASENILLAAEALGLGAVWTAVYPNKELMDFVRKELDIPQHVIPLNLIPVGHPTGDEKALDKFDAKNIRWQKWGGDF
ncbi:MAG: nitroreductase family protein [Ferruginibacter sp.]|nr:nitroreductase family protein [Ferruginibacter sp.]